MHAWAGYRAPLKDEMAGFKYYNVGHMTSDQLASELISKASRETAYARALGILS